MTAGYVRLSRDDDKRNYSSIENQKLIIRQYASEHHFTIDNWYEDDGVSGYLFDRPGFNQLMEDLSGSVDTVIVKDFSRLGRHNAKLLLLLDYFREQNRRLIVIDDHYDSETSEDDTIGITTWFNERYVKDTSRKIRHAIGAKQKEGTLITPPPFGYQRIGSDKSSLTIVPREAEYILKIYDLYLQGLGCRKISNYLTMQGIPTPSMLRRERELKEGKNTSRQVALRWSDGMVKDILSNDFYTGTLRLHKRARSTIHGRDFRVSDAEQYVFENHHPPIIDKMTFSLVQDLKEKRIRSGYKGSHAKQNDPEPPAPFGNCLFCKDCRKKLTLIRRKNSLGGRRYYICSTYNSKGKRYCSSSHLIEEQTLIKDLIYYLETCRNAFAGMAASWNNNTFIIKTKSHSESCIVLKQEIEDLKRQFQTLLTQKIRDLALCPGSEAIVKESYDVLQQDLTIRIHTLEKELENLKNAESSADAPPPAPLDILDNIIQSSSLTHKDIETLIDSIIVDRNGFPEIRLKHYRDT